ncbi:MAG TPA: cytochrome P460 family protein [Acetobacteraceae bacterium]
MKLIQHAALLLLAYSSAHAASLCADEMATPQIPTDLGLCAELDPIVRKPSALPLDQYEIQLNRYVSAMCHRNAAGGWRRDKTVRDTGPFIATLAEGKWTGIYFGTHAPVLVWYSPEMLAWLHANRPDDPARVPSQPTPIPDGAIMVKEMYSPPPASSCRVTDLLRLRPNTQGMAVMVRDNAAARDGWFWGAIGWQGYTPDWPPPAANTPALSGFGQYCTNCHSSARDNQTFASLDNIEGEPGSILTFLSEDFFLTQSDQVFTRYSKLSQHEKVRRAALKARLTTQTPVPPGLADMPSQAYDHAWVMGAGPNAASAFVTSDQCVGCHTAGGTGLQYEMTTPGPDSQLFNLSPYGTWRTSPMGLSGRDPIFFAQLASETQTFHRAIAPKVEDSCLGCHGIMGERQAKIDSAPAQSCPDFPRTTVDAVPFPTDNPSAPLALYGGLARDGVSCAACHHMVLREADAAKYRDAPQNRCVAERQAYFNPDNSGFARTVTGSFLIGAPDAVYGPFADPKTVPMHAALGIEPAQNGTITSPEMCGTCHTVHLPVVQGTQKLASTYEQTTYPEWAFSDYRTGETPDGKLPFGPGPLAQACQGCHMPNTAADGSRFRSKIASIQERSKFPQVENGLPAKDIDLPVREGFARHVLVGLNVFLIEMARQYSGLLGIATQDPMLQSQGVPPLDFTRDAILDQATNRSAAISVANLQNSQATLTASVTVTNKTGHKLPSGVAFRRMFIDFRVIDAAGNTLWESGRTDKSGVLIDQHGQPIEGELWWKQDCSARIGGDNPHQPHYQSIARQDQVQIYQELVTAPLAGAAGQCGPHASPAGELTTSFLSICARLKDNRLLPTGFLPLDQRVTISRALGAAADMAEDTDAVGIGADPDYRSGGADTIVYRIPRGDIAGQPAAVEAILYYQAIPPFYLQDRRCTATGADRDRLAYLARAVNLTRTPAADWKLRMVTSGRVSLPR